MSRRQARFRTAGGDILTDEDIEALADEAERGYDLTKAKRVHMGRPGLGDGGTSPRVQVRVDPDLAKALRAPAPARSIARSARSPAERYASTWIARPDRAEYAPLPTNGTQAQAEVVPSSARRKPNADQESEGREE